VRPIMDASMKQSSQDLWRNLGLGIFVVAVALGTLYVFPALSYVSIVGYGFPASLLVLAGYATWLILQHVNKRLAQAFLVAFASPILFFLIFLLMTPHLPFMIIAPTFCLWLARRILARHRQQERQGNIPGIS
ncbi:MAG: hypothetical protein DMG06_28245, partial [Acidobacteria bacterium]